MFFSSDYIGHNILTERHFKVIGYQTLKLSTYTQNNDSISSPMCIQVPRGPVRLRTLQVEQTRQLVVHKSF